MKIGIDARLYGTQVKGLGRYTQKLIEEFAKSETNFEFVVFLNKEGFKEFDIKDKRFKAVEVDIPWYGFKEQFQLPKTLRQHNLDLMHFPHFNVPYFYKDPFVMTLHDLILLDHPSRRASKLGWLKYFLKFRAYKINLRSALKRAQKIITVSNYSKSRIEKHFPFTNGKIVVTLLSGEVGGAPLKTAETKTIVNPPGCKAASSERERYGFKRESRSAVGITKPYLLYVGNAYPHKNLEFLVNAFHKFWQSERGRQFQLVFVGKSDYFYERLGILVDSLEWVRDDSKNVGEHVLDSQNKPAEPQIEPIKIFGYASEAQLAKIYKNAHIYVFPSLDEGFGIPPLEAMEQGVPVLASNQASLPEVLGNAALYFSPTDQADLLNKLSTLVDNSTIRAGLIEKGREQVRLYSWEKTAQQTLEVYEAAAQNLI